MLKDKSGTYQAFDDVVVDVDEVVGTDVKINPDFYIHTALLKAQSCLVKDDVKGGLTQFRILVEHIEALCVASNMLSQDYDDELVKFKADLSGDGIVGDTKIANKKLELLLKEVFGHKVATSPMKA